MNLLNLPGAALMAVIMIPNILFTLRNPDGFENTYSNQTVERLEQVGRCGCFGCMMFNIPYLCRGFWFPHALPVYLAVNGVLVLAYCLIWKLCWNQSNVFKALALSILPSLVFLISGILLLHLPLIILSLLFAACHITISYQNAVLSDADTDMEKDR